MQPEVAALTATRLTYGVYDTGEIFTNSDDWSSSASAHAALRWPWTGMKMFSERSCANTNEIVDRVCALQNQEYTLGKRVHFRTDDTGILGVKPFSEAHESHYHFILANKSGWVRRPARADDFTGQMYAVMRARRQDVSRLMRSKSSKTN